MRANLFVSRSPMSSTCIAYRRATCGGVVEAYLEEAHQLGFRDIRIIHGRGIGVQREIVRAVLARTSYVMSYADAPPEAGGWGATIARLHP